MNLGKIELGPQVAKHQWCGNVDLRTSCEGSRRWHLRPEIWEAAANLYILGLPPVGRIKRRVNCTTQGCGACGSFATPVT